MEKNKDGEKGNEERIGVSPYSAESLRTSGRYAESVECFNEWLKSHPKDAWSLAHRGAAKASVGDHKGAIEDLDKAIDLKGRVYPWAWAQKGEACRVYIRDGIPWTSARKDELHQQIKESLKAFQEAIDQSKGYTWAYAHKGATHALAYLVYTIYPELGDKPHEHEKLAETCFSVATQLNPSYAWAYAFKAVFYSIVGKFNVASDVMGTALMVSTNSQMPSHRALAELSYWDKQYPCAITQGWLARRADPEDLLASYYIALSHRFAKQPCADELIEYARRRLSTLLNIVHMLLGGIYYAQGHELKAAEMLKFLLGKQDLESMFIARRDPLWLEAQKDVDKNSYLGRVLSALLAGSSEITPGDHQ